MREPFNFPSLKMNPIGLMKRLSALSGLFPNFFTVSIMEFRIDIREIV